MKMAFLAAAVVLAPAAHAQYNRVPGAARVLPAMSLPAAAVLSPLRAPTLGALAAPSLRPSAPVLAPMASPIAAPAVGLPAAAALPAAPVAKAPVSDSLSGIVSAVDAAKAGPSGVERAGLTLGNFFDAGGFGRGSGPEAFRPPDGREDRRINAALQALGRSPVGLSVYQHVYQKHGSALSIKVDDDRNASYDARLVREDGRPVLYLTESLVNGPVEATAAFIAREFADLYFEDFPVSAERAYMSYGVMTRTFAEMTNSDLASNGYAWDHSRDRYDGGAYVLQRYYGSWKEATQSRDPRASAFFRFLQSIDDSNADPRAKLSLRQQYDRGLISYSTYRQMRDYFDGIVRSEVDWLGNTGRW